MGKVGLRHLPQSGLPVGITRGLQAASRQARRRLPLGITRGIQFRELASPPGSPSVLLSARLCGIGFQPPAFNQM